MNFDSNGDPPAFYELISWFPRDSLKIEFLVVGSFNSTAGPDQQLSISSQSILWNGAQKRQVFCIYVTLHYPFRTKCNEMEVSIISYP